MTNNLNILIRSDSWEKSNSYHWIVENMSLSGSEFKLLFHPIQPKPYVKVGIRCDLVLPILVKKNGQLSHEEDSRKSQKKRRIV